ncbi:LapD/MoxY N-terminal periplasmic domain-containing protein [Methylomarinum sp. Ch1-1]|uniref:LapD/MoxY N-terminal periplasmic domain-containing protein n=1 Tax=Methylomarinum roseum TaxID=3067653 RepID=A0AAU7NUN8_9GAMM|nr:LapD/MoxY N-terminal periplasmic domain-containing protein [Methylomarinum sp. Ch1-1]MDP4519217.1 LapD/MoxY N-terminal periplasmic domain-containing protein [Methylomarinum sp. Ch1-1]
MSLFKQLLFLVSALFLIIFAVNFALSVSNIRDYLEGESEIHAQDTATSLGLSLSPYMVNEKDPVIETMIQAIFDMGYYQEIRLENIDDEPLVTLKNDKVSEEVPEWFVELLPMETATAKSEISSGWNLSGIIYVTINPGYAYLKLYQQAKSGFYYSMAAFAFSILILFLLLRITLRSLKRIDRLALKIAAGQYETIDEMPWTTEVRNVTRSMNTLSGKIDTTIKNLNGKLNDIGKKLHQDALTGLNKKSVFETDLKRLFAGDSEAFIYLVKIDSLGTLVKEYDSAAIDRFLQDCAKTLNKTSEQFQHGQTTTYRFFGSEFAILLEEVDIAAAEELAKHISTAFSELGEKNQKSDIAHIGIIPFDPLKNIDQMLAAANEAYEQAQLIGANGYYLKTNIDQARDIAEWKKLVFAIVDNRTYDVSYVCPINGFESNQMLMEDAFIQAQDDNGNSLAIGTFVSIAEKFAKIVELDKGMIANIVDSMKHEKIQHARTISISTRTIKNSEFRTWLHKLIRENQDMASRLVFNLSAYAIAKDIDTYQQFIAFIHDLGAKVMIKRFDAQSLSPDAIKPLRPDYIRLSRDICDSVADDAEKKAFIELIQEMSSLLNIKVLAENVHNDIDYEVLHSIGIAGASR